MQSPILVEGAVGRCCPNDRRGREQLMREGAVGLLRRWVATLPANLRDAGSQLQRLAVERGSHVAFAERVLRLLAQAAASTHLHPCRKASPCRMAVKCSPGVS